jgi:hypothetical protein
VFAGLHQVPVFGQTISGIIAGTIVDPSGAALPAVSITVQNPETGRAYVASTSDQGYYRIPEVPPGLYEVTAELGGFQSQRHVGVRVSVNRVTLEDFTLEIPPQVEVVEVVSSASMRDTTGPTIAKQFPDRKVRDLPILTRDVNNLALLVPGVTSVRTFSFASTLVPFSVNGSRGRDNNFIIDSVDNNEPLFGGAATQFTNTDIFAEYAILTNQLKAEFGRNSGGTVNAITKSGSNVLHGTLFWFGQDDSFNARNRVEKTAFLDEPTTFYENVAGFTLGGPLKRDKSFFFISYQWDRARNNLSSLFPVIATLPTADGLNTLAGFPQTPALQELLNSPTVAQVPLVSGPCFESPPPTGFSTTNPCQEVSTLAFPGVEYNTFLVPGSNIFDVRDHQASLRFDQRLGNADDLYARYLFDDLKTPRAPLSPTGESAFSDLGLFPEYRNILRQRTQSFLLNERHYGVNSLNELRFSFSRIAQEIGTFDLPKSVREAQPSAVVGDDYGFFGQFTAQFLAAGTRFTLGRDSRPSTTASNIYQIQDNFSYYRGRHSLKVGVNIVRTQSNIRSTPSDLGLYMFGQAGAGGTGLSSFLDEPAASDCPGILAIGFSCTNAFVVLQRFPNVLTDASGLIIGQGQDSLPLRGFDQFYFIQDDIRLGPNFTLNLGLRYENYSQPINKIRKLNPAGPRVSRDNNNFAPRIGFAWSPWKGGALRGGYSLTLNPMALNIPLLIWQSGPISPLFVADAFGFSIIKELDPNDPVPNIPGLCGVFGTTGNCRFLTTSGAFPNQPLSLADVNVSVAGCSSFLGGRSDPGDVPLLNCSGQDTVAADLVNPYIQNFSLGIQQELGSNWLFELYYVGSKGTKLYQRVDVNPFGGWDIASLFPDPLNPNTPLTPLTSVFRNQFLFPRADDTRGGVTRVTNGGRSIYHSLQFSLDKRLGRTLVGDFAFSTAYTWSHLIDNASEIFGPGLRFLQPDPLTAILGTDALETVEAITPLAQDPNNLAAERGNSAFDRRHRLALSYLWEIAPTGGFWAGGWQFSGIVTFQSGQFFTPLNARPFFTGNFNGDPAACADVNGDGRVTNDRPDIGNPSAPVGTVALLADPNCVDVSLGYVDLAGNPVDPSTVRFVQVPLGAGRVGTAGRNIIEGPGLANVDIAFFKNFRWGERYNLQFRWEIFNLFNTPNPGNSIGNVFATDAQPTPAFAFSPRVTAAGVTGVVPENTIDATDRITDEPNFLSRRFMNTSSRKMQFGLKFIF